MTSQPLFSQWKTVGTSPIGFTSANVAKNLIVAVIGWSGTANLPSLTDTLGNTYTFFNKAQSDSATNYRGVWYVLSCLGGTNSITVTPGSGGTLTESSALEFTIPTGTTTVVDTSSEVINNNCPNTGATSPYPVTITNQPTLSVGNELYLWQMHSQSGPITFSNTNANYTILVPANGSAFIAHNSGNPNAAGSLILTASTDSNTNTYSHLGIGFYAKSSFYSQPDCRTTKPNSATSRIVNGTLIYDIQTSSNSGIPPTDSRAAKPVASGIYPQNSRTPGTYGPND